MALKDLTTKGSVLTEKQVEEIISKYVRYDVENKQIHFLFDFNPLTTRNKILVYLVALHGWPFLAKETMPLEATPATIGKAINVDGGTLRPTLKGLKDAHVISATGKMYRVHSAALSQINDILKGTEKLDRVIRLKVRPKKSKAPSEPKKATKEGGAKKKNQRDLLTVFNKFVTDGFFDQPRVIGDIKNRFAEKGLPVPLSSIPKMLLKATKNDKITREKKEINKRNVWVYQRKK